MHIRLFTGLIAVVALAGVAGAAPSLEFSIGLCASKTNVKARLACYDAIAAQLKAGQVPAAAPLPVPAPAAALRPALDPAPVAAAPAPVVAAPTPVPAAAPPSAAKPVAPEVQFGSEQMPKEARQATGQIEEAEEIHSALKSFSFTPTGRVIVTLDNGQVWRQIDGDSSKFRAKQGEIVTIARAILGSYSMTVGDRNALFKVRRVR